MKHEHPVGSADRRTDRARGEAERRADRFVDLAQSGHEARSREWRSMLHLLLLAGRGRIETRGGGGGGKVSGGLHQLIELSLTLHADPDIFLDVVESRIVF